jgi:hypothetical protein
LITEGGYTQPVSVGGKWGYIDRRCKVVLPVSYIYARPFSEGLAHVVIQDESGEDLSAYIDNSGAILFKAPFKHCEDFHESFAIVELEKGRFGFIDRQGSLAINVGADGCFPFSEGLARACVGGNWGYIDQARVPPRLLR